MIEKDHPVLVVSLKKEKKYHLERLYSEFAIFSKQQIPGNDGLTVEVYNAFWESLVVFSCIVFITHLMKVNYQAPKKMGK